MSVLDQLFRHVSDEHATLSRNALESGRRDKRIVIRRLSATPPKLNAAIGEKARARFRGDPISILEHFIDCCALHSCAKVPLARCIQTYSTLRDSAHETGQTSPQLLRRLSEEDLELFWAEIWSPILQTVPLKRQVSSGPRCPEPTKQRFFAGWFVVFLVSPGLETLQAELQLKSIIARGAQGLVYSAREGELTVNREQLGAAKLAVVCPDPNLARRVVSHPSRHGGYAVYRKEWASDSLRHRKVLSERVYAHRESTPTKTPPVFEAEKVLSQLSTGPSVSTGSISYRDSSIREKRRRSVSRSESFAPGPSKIAKSLRFSSPASLKASSLEHICEEKPATGPFSSINAKEFVSSAASFQCQSGLSPHDFATKFPNNALIVDLLGKLATFWEVACPRDANSKHRVSSYQKTCSVLRRLEYDLLTLEQVDELVVSKKWTFIGNRIGGRLAEIVRTGRLVEAEEKEASPVYAPIRELSGIWGVGPATAYKLMGMGIRSVGELRKRFSKDSSILDQNQRVGLRHYEDLLLRIPRSEVKELEELLEYHVRSINPCGSVQIQITGSYIRGRSSCGDVDVMVYGDGREVEFVMQELVKALKRGRIITDELVDGDAKYFCVYRLRPGTPHRRLDLFSVPMEEYAFALLTYTGSGKFNRSMRCRARQLGYSLSHKGISRVSRHRIPGNKGDEKLVLGPQISCSREEDIFALLGIDYKSPHERDL